MLIIIIAYISGNSKERGEKVPLRTALPRNRRQGTKKERSLRNAPFLSCKDDQALSTLPERRHLEQA